MPLAAAGRDLDEFIDEKAVGLKERPGADPVVVSGSVVGQVVLADHHRLLVMDGTQRRELPRLVVDGGGGEDRDALDCGQRRHERLGEGLSVAVLRLRTNVYLDQQLAVVVIGKELQSVQRSMAPAPRVQAPTPRQSPG